MISLLIPKGKSKKKLIESELAVAKNIKSKATRDSITTGLKKILENYSDGKAFYWIENQLQIFDYYGIDSLYNCSKDIIVPEINPAHICINCDKYIGCRGFCSKKCHDEWYDKEYGDIEDDDYKPVIPVDDVKYFIKLIKHDIYIGTIVRGDIPRGEVMEIINDASGDKLI